MKNLVWAVGGLIIIIIAIFIFASKQKMVSDVTIPSPVNVSTPTPTLSNLSVGQNNPNQSSSGANKMQLPFEVLPKDQIDGKKVRISTDFGDIVFALTSDAPIASSNFIYLVNKNFYNGLIFHRVIKGFMIQGGDPNGNGTGGPGYQFPDELNPSTTSYQNGYTSGVVAMANAGPNTNGSQFFIMHQDNQLPHNYSIFGKVISGMDVVEKIANMEVDSNNKPKQPVLMKKVTLE